MTSAALSQPVARASASSRLVASCSSSGSDHARTRVRGRQQDDSARERATGTGSLVQADALGNTVIGGPYRTLADVPLPRDVDRFRGRGPLST